MNVDDDDFEYGWLFVGAALLELIRRHNYSVVSDEMVLCQIATEAHVPGAPIDTVNLRAQGSMSHRGLMQVSPEAAREGSGLGNGVRDTDERLKTRNPVYINSIYKADTNIRAGTMYLNVLMARNKGNIKAAYRAYRGRTNDVYYNKISACAEHIKKGNYKQGLQVIYPGGSMSNIRR